MNFTQTAKRLYISQQALSQHIGKLESQYGVPLFTRKPQLMLSYAGETLLPHAERLLQEEALVESMFSDISDQERGSLRISVTIPRCRLFLTEVISKFKQRYPNVALDVINPSTSAALDMVVKGDCNIAVGLLRKKHPDLELVSLTEDPWYLLVPDVLLRQYYNRDEIDQILSQEFVHLSMLARLPLITANPMSDPEGAFPNHYYGSGAVPNVLFTSSCPQNFLEFALEGISCIVASQMALLTYQSSLPEHIHVLPLMLGSFPDHTSTISLAHNKARHMPPYGEFFIRLVQEFFETYNANKA